MKGSELKKACLDLIASVDEAYVTTVDERGYPQTRCMFNLRSKKRFPRLVDIFRSHSDDFMVLFTTNTSSAKITHIRQNPAACIYYCIPDGFEGLMLSGDLEIVDDPKIREEIWHPGWEQYYPQGPHDPDHTVLRLCPTKAKGWMKTEPFSFEFPDKK
ncbi:MAG: pyridoxamine 5'-phosphate oxidase family protein [candidate division WOR-3 bacterium]|nr:MAG: pyridoxamine 5'-phosphate oxidase family protein [candidate division WOR-3 bacterium]